MDRVRQGVFSSLGDFVENVVVCDLFAGTGSYGLEALSRGAEEADFVEIDKRSCSVIKENTSIVAKSMKLGNLAAKVHPSDATIWKTSPENKYDLIFCDPPYELIERLSDKLFRQFDRLLKPNGLVAFEMPGELTLEATGWTLRKRLGKGKNQPTVCFYERG